MTPLDLLWHLAGFLMPAAVLSVGVAAGARIFMKHRRSPLSLPKQTAINFVVCVAVLLSGLMITGQDGRMLTYVALVLCSAACQLWLLRRN